MKKDGDILILDVTVPFENGIEAFRNARTVKEQKYNNLASELSVNGLKARVEAVIVGSLGSWDSANDKVISRLCSKNYAALMRKLIVSETIGNSSKIYYEHISGVPQDDVVGPGLPQE